MFVVLTFFTFLWETSFFYIVLPAIFITQLAHSCFPFSFVVEALSAKVMHRTGRSADRPTATGTHGHRILGETEMALQHRANGQQFVS